MPKEVIRSSLRDKHQSGKLRETMPYNTEMEIFNALLEGILPVIEEIINFNRAAGESGGDKHPLFEEKKSA